MDSDTDDELSYLKPQLFAWKTSQIPIVEITADVDEYEADYKDSSTYIKDLSGSASKTPVHKKNKRARHRRQNKVSENNLSGKCPKQKNDNISRTFNKEYQVDGNEKSSDNVKTAGQQNLANGSQRSNANVSWTDNKENQFDEPEWSSSKVNWTVSRNNKADGPQRSNDSVSRTVGQDSKTDGLQRNGDISRTDIQDSQIGHHQLKLDNVSRTDCQHNQAECQTTITGDVFALNFYHGNDYANIIPLEGVDSLVTLNEAEKFLSLVQSSLVSPGQFVGIEDSGMQTEDSFQNSNFGDGRLRGDGAESVNQTVQLTDCLEVETCADQMVQTITLEVEKMDKGIQTEHFHLDLHSNEQVEGVETVDQSVQTECLEVLTGICKGQENAENDNSMLECFDHHVDVQASVSGDVASSSFQQDSKSTSVMLVSEQQETKTESSSSWLNRLFLYSVVPLVFRFILVGMCAVLNFIRHHIW